MNRRNLFQRAGAAAIGAIAAMIGIRPEKAKALELSDDPVTKRERKEDVWLYVWTSWPKPSYKPVCRVGEIPNRHPATIYFGPLEQD